MQKGRWKYPRSSTALKLPRDEISYFEQGKGPVALFVHGVLLNGYLWRHQLADLSDIRRCIAVDLLAHGDTETDPGQDVSVTANAKMLNFALSSELSNARGIFNGFSPPSITSRHSRLKIA